MIKDKITAFHGQRSGEYVQSFLMWSFLDLCYFVFVPDEQTE